MPRQLVLVVENIETERTVVCAALRRMGYMAFECQTMSEARAAFKTKPDAFFIDVGLTDGNGFDLCREVRAQPEFARSAIILTSEGLSPNFDDSMLFACGADAFLAKPFDDEQLNEALRSAFDHRI